MQNFFSDTKYLIGKSDGGKWSGIFVLSEESKNIQQSGQIFVIINLVAPPEFNSQITGDLLLENIQDVYYDESKGPNPIVRLEKAIMSTAKRLEYLLERENMAAETGIDLNITAIVLKEDFIYMGVLGEGSVMLWREKTLIDLTSGLRDLTGRDLIKSGSGKIRAGDVFVLLSPSARLAVSEHELRGSIKQFNLQNLEKNKEDPQLGILLVKIMEAKDKVFLSKEPALPSKKEEVEESEKIGFLKETSEVSFESDDRHLDQDDSVEDVQDYEDEKTDALEKGPLSPEEEYSKAGKEGRGEGKASGIKGFGLTVKDKLRDKKTYQVLFVKLKEFLLKIYQWIKKYIWQGFMGMGGKGLYLKGAGPKSSVRGVIILMILVVSLLYISIRAIQRHKDTSAKVKEVSTILSEVDESFNSGRDLGEAGDIAESVAIIEEAMNKLERAKEYEVLLDEIEGKISEGTNIMDEVRKVIVVTEDNLITDIAGFIEGAGANDIMLKSGKLYIADASTSAIYEVGFEGGDVREVAGGDTPLGKPDAIAFDSEGNMLISDLESGILKLSLEEGEVESLTGLSVSSVGEVTEIENYAIQDGSNFLYLLRGNNNDVRKISKYSSGYSLPTLRLADSRFNGAHDIEIDGKVYILTQQDGILRYYGDTPDPYTIVGLDKPITTSNCIELDFSLVFLGDSSLKRIVVITKGSYLAPQQGKYVAQFLYRGEGEPFSDIREIVVDNDERLMFVLAGTKIFKVELTQVDQYAEKLE